MPAQELVTLPRPIAAPVIAEFVQRISSLDFTKREQEIFIQITEGNVPGFYRRFCPVSVTNVAEGKTNTATFYVAPDYLAVGSDEDYFFTPMTPVTAQRIADRLGCILPTRKMVNDIYEAATVKLAPSPISPGPRMITMPVFAQHNAVVRTQRAAQLAEHPLGALVAGGKKDIVITSRLTNSPGKVAIYGWHKTDGTAIQPLYLGHVAAWTDYSHGVRLVLNQMRVNGDPKTVAEVLADPKLASLLSDEGVVTTTRYAPDAFPSFPSALNEALEAAQTNSSSWSFMCFQPSPPFYERTMDFKFEPEVKIHINVPQGDLAAPDKPVMLIFYALPNGSTTDQTIGRKPQSGDDWHFDIQHIGAQTRFLRELLTNRTIVVAYLEAELRSWPAWRKKHGDKLIPQILGSVMKIFATNRLEVMLTSTAAAGV